MDKFIRDLKETLEKSVTDITILDEYEVDKGQRLRKYLNPFYMSCGLNLPKSFCNFQEILVQGSILKAVNSVTVYLDLPSTTAPASEPPDVVEHQK